MTQPLATDFLRIRAQAYPDRAPLTVDGGARLTYALWDKASNRVAHALRGRGVGRGDRVLLLFGGLDWTEYAVAYLGVLKTGAAAVHVNDREPDGEVARRIGQTGPAGAIHGPSTAPPGGVAWVSTVDGLDGPDGPVDVTPGLEDVADILYTSGTTGPAKPFSNPHGNLSFGRAVAAAAKVEDAVPMLTPMSLGTTSSTNIVGMFALAGPNSLIVCAPDDPERIAALIEQHRITSVMLPPFVAIALLHKEVAKRYDLSCVTSIGTASAPMPSPVARGLLDAMPNATIHTAYAQSEAVPAIVVNAYDPDRPRCLGRPGPGTELRIDEPRDGIGEIWLRCAAPKRLYLDAALNAQVHADGWTRTRDLGSIGPDGLLYLFDRAADAVPTAAGLVSSIEVEDVLFGYPAVREAAVFGVPVGPGTEAVVAVVAPAEGDIDPAGLRAFAAQRLAPHQVPVSVLVVPALPRGVSGKVRKAELRQRYARL
jgi:acyl-CoA synthetase (AMP-forming)/AMP-acid ligase II